VFHRFRQAEFAHGGFISKASFVTTPAASENDTYYKVAKIDSKNNHLATLIHIRLHPTACTRNRGLHKKDNKLQFFICFGLSEQLELIIKKNKA
jgi:hypothetical protein